MKVIGRLVVLAATLGGLIAAPAQAAHASVAVNGCVRTVVYKGPYQWVGIVRVYNACSYTLPSVRAHVFNGPAGVDRWWPTAANMGPGGMAEFRWSPSWWAPPGSLTCGELKGTNGTLYGRDCITM